MSAFDPEQFARQTADAVQFTDEMMSDLEQRLIRIEELVAARWPRSMFLRRRLARELRASVAGYDHIEGFRAKRLEAAGDAVIVRSRRTR